MGLKAHPYGRKKAFRAPALQPRAAPSGQLKDPGSPGKVLDKAAEVAGQYRLSAGEALGSGRKEARNVPDLWMFALQEVRSGDQERRLHRLQEARERLRVQAGEERLSN
jgi:hypothetical protein